MRREKRLTPDLRPLTPEQPTAAEPLTYAEVVAQNNYAEYLLKTERRRHAFVEKQFVKSLNEVQDCLDNVRQLYIAAIAPKPAPSERNKQ